MFRHYNFPVRRPMSLSSLADSKHVKRDLPSCDDLLISSLSFLYYIEYINYHIGR